MKQAVTAISSSILLCIPVLFLGTDNVRILVAASVISIMLSCLACLWKDRLASVFHRTPLARFLLLPVAIIIIVWLTSEKGRARCSTIVPDILLLVMLAAISLILVCLVSKFPIKRSAPTKKAPSKPAPSAKKSSDMGKTRMMPKL